MFNNGIILTYGTKAIAIQDKNKQQYYAPFDNVDSDVFDMLDKTIRLSVIFKIDYENYSGYIKGKKRFYAYDVKLYDTILI
tara:strand:- start:4775 stop:5017 length:243 start_codon:yes stop_codon:yes gene_type:complete